MCVCVQIIPFLALGLGVNDMFILTHQMGEISSSAKNSIPYMVSELCCAVLYVVVMCNVRTPSGV